MVALALVEGAFEFHGGHPWPKRRESVLDGQSHSRTHRAESTAGLPLHDLFSWAKSRPSIRTHSVDLGQRHGRPGAAVPPRDVLLEDRPKSRPSILSCFAHPIGLHGPPRAEQSRPAQARLPGQNQGRISVKVFRPKVDINDREWWIEQ